jgi:hypothetical protein
MDPKKFEAMQVRVDGACGITVATSHIDGQYRLHYTEDVDATLSAHIVLFSLLPNTPELPAFHGRWDDAASSVDVDLDGSHRQRFAFKWRLPGFSGHHTTRVVASQRRYVIDIHIPGLHVFQGEITLGTKIGMTLQDDAFHMRADVAVSATVVSPNLFRRMTHWLYNLFTCTIA